MSTEASQNGPQVDTQGPPGHAVPEATRAQEAAVEPPPAAVIAKELLASLPANPELAPASRSGQQLHRRHELERLGPLHKTLIEGHEPCRSCAACQVQRIGKVHALVEGIERCQHRVAVL